MTVSIKAVQRSAMITTLVALLTAGGSQAEPIRPGIKPRPAGLITAAQKPSVILRLSDNPGPGQSPGPPAYAGIAIFFINTDGDWVAIELLRQRSCIPAGF